MGRIPLNPKPCWPQVLAEALKLDHCERHPPNTTRLQGWMVSLPAVRPYGGRLRTLVVILVQLFPLGLAFWGGVTLLANFHVLEGLVSKLSDMLCPAMPTATVALSAGLSADPTPECWFYDLFMGLAAARDWAYDGVFALFLAPLAASREWRVAWSAVWAIIAPVNRFLVQNAHRLKAGGPVGVSWVFTTIQKICKGLVGLRGAAGPSPKTGRKWSGEGKSRSQPRTRSRSRRSAGKER